MRRETKFGGFAFKKLGERKKQEKCEKYKTKHTSSAFSNNVLT